MTDQALSSDPTVFDHFPPAEIAEWIANQLRAKLDDREHVFVVGPLDDKLTVVVLQPKQAHVMIQVNYAEIVLR